MRVPTDRPTAPPEFDLGEYAKQSEARTAIASPVTPAPQLDDLLDPSSEVRIVARAPIGQFLSLEAWARQVSGMLVVKAPPDVIKQLPLDHRAGFLMSLMDGMLDLETLLEIAGMPRDEVLEIVQELHETGVVEFE